MYEFVLQICESKQVIFVKEIQRYGWIRSRPALEICESKQVILVKEIQRYDWIRSRLPSITFATQVDKFLRPRLGPAR
jgi:hypothetical protein